MVVECLMFPVPGLGPLNCFGSICHNILRSVKESSTKNTENSRLIFCIGIKLLLIPRFYNLHMAENKIRPL